MDVVCVGSLIADMFALWSDIGTRFCARRATALRLWMSPGPATPLRRGVLRGRLRSGSWNRRCNLPARWAPPAPESRRCEKINHACHPERSEGSRSFICNAHTDAALCMTDPNFFTFLGCTDGVFRFDEALSFIAENRLEFTANF